MQIEAFKIYRVSPFSFYLSRIILDAVPNTASRQGNSLSGNLKWTMASKIDLSQLVQKQAKPMASYRIYCFPWAGGGSRYYANWGKLLPDSIEACSIRLPGRESLYNKAPYEDAAILVKELSEMLLPGFREKPFAFFGHSMGAFLAFEIARYLKEHHDIEPIHLVVSGVSAPHSEMRKSGRQYLSRLSDDEFLEKIKKIGGTPKEVSENKDLMKIFLPILKADFKIIENYDYVLSPTGPILRCPITVYDGTGDKPHDIKAWSELSHGHFTSQMLPGGHFYLFEKENERKILDHITKLFQVEDAAEIV